MRTLPILMSPPMVLATMREIERPGTGKTETRRALTAQPPGTHGLVGLYAPRLTAVFNPAGRKQRGDPDQDVAVPLRFMPKDRLYVREAWQAADWYDPVAPRIIPREAYVAYLADGETNSPTDEDEIGLVQSGDWGRNRIGMHMPRWASRITLVVTEVVVERLDEITEEGAYREGIETDRWDMAPVARRYDVDNGWFVGWSIGITEPNIETDAGEVARSSYRTLWNSLNASRGLGWEANPWVVVIRFTPHLCNVDQMEATNG